ncbi:MAG: bifunctional demethylmenaquinone methyltransferase/2-methoxy-6-polyprenyl-1,4-benzoquinol methylase UbiE [Ignavibacteria bacterium]|nr:bifunctional demethylmenaquinone methyltransferase/2-methoxy-6-polyprenyl-1,4-benzoquinol methylase UbiE [Ignavibacteria bacterium]
MSEKKQQVRKMFDAIAGKYDFLNHFLSAGVDFYWRKKALNLTKIPPDAVLLDIACGTGDFAAAIRKAGVQDIFGADLSFQMLQLFGKKANWIRGKRVQTIAESLPYIDETFSNITVAFGVRNFYDIPLAFHEFYRILKPGGKVTVLEFSLPTNPVIRAVYTFYFKKVLPVIGRIISGDESAYTYLPNSVEEFDKKVDLQGIFLKEKFASVKKNLLTFGLVQVVIAQK